MESSVDEAVQHRGAHNPLKAAELLQEPMFCFESAVSHQASLEASIEKSMLADLMHHCSQFSVWYSSTVPPVLESKVVLPDSILVSSNPNCCTVF